MHSNCDLVSWWRSLGFSDTASKKINWFKLVYKFRCLCMTELSCFTTQILYVFLNLQTHLTLWTFFVFFFFPFSLCLPFPLCLMFTVKKRIGHSVAKVRVSVRSLKWQCGDYYQVFKKWNDDLYTLDSFTIRLLICHFIPPSPAILV